MPTQKELNDRFAEIMARAMESGGSVRSVGWTTNGTGDEFNFLDQPRNNEPAVSMSQEQWEAFHKQFDEPEPAKRKKRPRKTKATLDDGERRRLPQRDVDRLNHLLRLATEVED